jgi:Rieske 2Fe-2S family protein
LPSAWYRRADVFALEAEHIFFREWLCIGRDEMIPRAGDHRVLDVAGQSILLLRNGAGQLRGFYNVCRHRGARLCGDPRLQGGVTVARTIMCPYHAWVYDLDGQLIGAPHMAGVAGFDATQVKLHPVGIETWGGFVFAHLSPNSAQPFAAQIAVVAGRLARYPLAQLRIAHSISYEVRANWKVLCENYNECYHCGAVHPELCRVVPAFREGGGAQLDWARGVPHREGADTFTLSGRSSRRSFPGLNDDEQVRHKGELIFPNLFVSLAREHVAAFLLEPKAADLTLITCHFLFEPYEISQPGFDPRDVVDFWDMVNKQDWVICEAVQQGMGARVHERGMLAPMEDWNLDIRRYVAERIGALVTP